MCAMVPKTTKELPIHPSLIRFLILHKGCKTITRARSPDPSYKMLMDDLQKLTPLPC